MGLLSGKHCNLYQYSCILLDFVFSEGTFCWILCFQKGCSFEFCVFRRDVLSDFCFQKGCSVGLCVYRRDVLFDF